VGGDHAGRQRGRGAPGAGGAAVSEKPATAEAILNGWVGTKLDELPPQSKKYLDGYHRKMNPHHEAMVRLDYHGAQQ